ncbi:hypothetical protein BC567DRAFT_15143 [Phyllosticta citribraziliensis]
MLLKSEVQRHWFLSVPTAPREKKKKNETPMTTTRPSDLLKFPDRLTFSSAMRAWCTNTTRQCSPAQPASHSRAIRPGGQRTTAAPPKSRLSTTELSGTHLPGLAGWLAGWLGQRASALEFGLAAHIRSSKPSRFRDPSQHSAAVHQCVCCAIARELAVERRMQRTGREAVRGKAAVGLVGWLDRRRLPGRATASEVVSEWLRGSWWLVAPPHSVPSCFGGWRWVGVGLLWRRPR